MSVALGALVVVAGGAAVTGIDLAEAEGAGLALVCFAGIAVLAAGLLAAAGLPVIVPLPGGRRHGAPGLVGLAWLGAGLALASPLVLLVAAGAIGLLAVRVTERPTS